jgi:hypothetical protein
MIELTALTERVMWHGVSYGYEKMSSEDRRKFDKWIVANAILGAVCAAGILAMAFAGFNSPGRSDAMIAANSKAGKAGSNIFSPTAGPPASLFLKVD